MPGAQGRGGLDIWEVRIHSIGCDPTQRNSADQAFELHVFRVELLDGETPKQMEPDMHGPWEEFTFKDMYERSDLMPGLYSFMVRNELLAEWGSPTFRTIHEAAAQLAALYDLYAPIGILVKPQAQWDEMDFLEYVRWSAVRRVVRRLPKWVLAPISYDVRKRGLKMVVLVRAELLGGHVHANVFTGRMVGNLSKSGSLVFREAEYPEFVTGLAARRSEEFEVFFEGHLAPEKRAV